MKFGTVTAVERYQRPGTMQRVVLRNNFIVNGTYTEPYDISSCVLFRREANISPSSVLDNSGLVSGTPLYTWSTSADASAYTGVSGDASSIYKVGDGQHAVVIDGINSVISNLSAGHYIEIWTVKMTAASDYQTFINEFELFQDSVVTTTEDVLLRTKHRLTPNRVHLGETVDIKVATEVTVQNKAISQEIRNIFNQSVVDEPKFRILKHNEDTNLPSWVEVSGYSDTSADVRLTSDNTMIFTLDTAVLTSGSITDLGSAHGNYSVEVKYDVLGETLISPLMYFTVR